VFEFGKIKDPLSNRQVLSSTSHGMFKDLADWKDDYIKKTFRDGMEEKLKQIAQNVEQRKLLMTMASGKGDGGNETN